MNSFHQTQNLSFLLTEILAEFESAVIINQEGQTLGLRYEVLPDLGTFAPLVEMASRYFPLNEGDLVLTNDPYSGGTTLSVLNFITAFKVGDQKFFLAVRGRLKPKLSSAKSLEDEGLRIPPTPIATGREMNHALLEIIRSHPMAPEGFFEKVTQLSQSIWTQVDLVKSWAAKNPTLLSRQNQKNLLNETQRRIHKTIDELPNGDHRLDLTFETGEVIRLHTEIKDKEVHFDFAGTTHSSRIFLTDQSTYGTCLGAFLCFLGQDFLINESAFSMIQVTTPKDCLLNAKYPSPIFEGLAEITSLLGSAVIQSLAEITKSRSMGLNGSVSTILTLSFSGGQFFFDPVAGGTGATDDSNGLDAFYFWVLSRRQPSIEEIERLYPITVLQSGIRPDSGGKGKHNGGHGMIREILVKEAGSLRWLLGHRNIQNKGLKGAQAGKPSELSVIKASGEELVISDPHGEIAVQAGDRILAASAGGGGLGKSP